MDDPGDWAMSAITKHDWAFSLYLISLSAVITATVGVFFGIGFLLLASPDPAAPPAEAVSAPLALEAQEVPSQRWRRLRSRPRGSLMRRESGSVAIAR